MYNTPIRGFTLIELMIVLTIVGILAAIAAPIYSDYVARTQFSEALNLSSGVKAAVGDAYRQNKDLAGLDSGEYSIPAQADTGGAYLDYIAVRNGEITAYFSDTSALPGDTMTLSPTVTDGAIAWTCSSTAAADKVPNGCR